MHSPTHPHAQESPSASKPCSTKGLAKSRTGQYSERRAAGRRKGGLAIWFLRSADSAGRRVVRCGTLSLKFAPEPGRPRAKGPTFTSQARSVSGGSCDPCWRALSALIRASHPFPLPPHYHHPTQHTGPPAARVHFDQAPRDNLHQRCLARCGPQYFGVITSPRGPRLHRASRSRCSAQLAFALFSGPRATPSASQSTTVSIRRVCLVAPNGRVRLERSTENRPTESRRPAPSKDVLGARNSRCARGALHLSSINHHSRQCLSAPWLEFQIDGLHIIRN